jgi:hypothetical protein
MVKKITCLSLDSENVKKLKQILITENRSLSDLVDNFIENYLLNSRFTQLKFGSDDDKVFSKNLQRKN